MIKVSMACCGFLVFLFDRIGLVSFTFSEKKTLEGTMIMLAVFGMLAGLPAIGLVIMWRRLKWWGCVFEKSIVLWEGKKPQRIDGVTLNG